MFRAVLPGMLVLAAAATAQSQDRTWPYFRHPGVLLESGKSLPSGLGLKNCSIELRLKKDNARVVVLGKDGQQLVHAAIRRPAGTHAVVVWGENIPYYQPWVYVNGKNMTWDERSRAAGKESSPEVWSQSPPASVKLEGAADELRVYPYAMSEPEIANAYARATGGTMTPLAPIAARFDYRMSIGRMNVLLDVAAQFGKARGAEVTFRTPAKTLDTVLKPLEAGGGVAAFDVGELAVGKYPVSVAALDQDGNTLAEEKFEFERIELPWLHNTLGLGETVYARLSP